MSENQQRPLAEQTEGGNLSQDSSGSSDEAIMVTDANVLASRKRKISLSDGIAAPFKVYKLLCARRFKTYVRL